MRRSESTLASCLLEIDRRNLYFEWGVSCTLDYAELILGFDRHTAREMMRMSRALADLPQLAEAYYGGAISASKMREITRVAVPETEAFWIEMAASNNTRQIEMMVARTVKGRKPNEPDPGSGRPRPVKTRVRLDLEPEQMATLMDAHALVCKLAGERVELTEAVELIAHDFLSTVHREEDVGNRYRMVIHCEPASKLAWVNTPKGPVRVSDETVEQALCDAEVLDLRKVSGEQPAVRDDDAAAEHPTFDVRNSQSRTEQEDAHPMWDIPGAGGLSQTEHDAEGPTWAIAGAGGLSRTEHDAEGPTGGIAGAGLSQTEHDTERPTWDIATAGGLSQTEHDTERPTWDIASAGGLSQMEHDTERPTWEITDVGGLSQTEYAAERPTWDIAGAGESEDPSQTEYDAERPTWDVADDGASPDDGLFPPKSELFRGPRREEEATAWQLLDEVAAGIRTRDGAATLARTVPPSVVRHVMARDQFRCSVPGCSLGIWKEVHHIQ